MKLWAVLLVCILVLAVTDAKKKYEKKKHADRVKNKKDWLLHQQNNEIAHGEKHPKFGHWGENPVHHKAGTSIKKNPHNLGHQGEHWGTTKKPLLPHHGEHKPNQKPHPFGHRGEHWGGDKSHLLGHHREQWPGASDDLHLQDLNYNDGTRKHKVQNPHSNRTPSGSKKASLLSHSNGTKEPMHVQKDKPKIVHVTKKPPTVKLYKSGKTSKYNKKTLKKKIPRKYSKMYKKY